VSTCSSPTMHSALMVTSAPDTSDRYRTMYNTNRLRCQMTLRSLSFFVLALVVDLKAVRSSRPPASVKRARVRTDSTYRVPELAISDSPVRAACSPARVLTTSY
jgi:hypothetical protein